MSKRPDALGLFWEDRPKVRATSKSGPRDWGPRPSIPETGWLAPAEFPNLSAAKVIGVDTETWDPELTTAGPGWGRGKGHIVGVSLSVADGTSWYFPTKHEEPDGSRCADNMDPEQVRRYLDYTLRDNRPKVGANLIYDLGWLQWEGVRVGGRLYDVQFAEALLDSETPRVALEDLAQKYLGKGKETAALYEWLAMWNSKAINSKQRRWIYKAPPSLVGPYAEEDAALPIQILQKQWPALSEKGLLPLFDLECRLIPLLVAMRLKGAPVNIDKAEEVYDTFGTRIKALSEQLTRIAGQPVNPSAPESMKSAFNALGLPFPEKKDKATGGVKTSFDKGVLSLVDHPLAEVVLEHRKLTKVRETFIKSYILDKNVDGRVYCTFHPLKGIANGARSGRFASSDPNLQNIPIRTEEGKLVRAAFDAHHTGGRWRSFDYKSIEYRLLAHHATGQGADEVRAIFAANPEADYHQIVKELIFNLTGIDLERTNVKSINFGIIYGMALAALAAALGLPQKEAKVLLDDYHAAAPYVRETMDTCSREVHEHGFVTTLMGRRSLFSMWGPLRTGGRARYHGPGLSYTAACREWGALNIARQHTHKALNRKLQGGAADVMKIAMVTAYEAGLFDETACGIPILTVHDELDFEDKGDLDNPAWMELKHVMETSTPGLTVPLRVDGGVGKTWADAH